MMMSASWRICGALLTVLSLAGCGLAQRAGQGATAVTDAIFYRKVDTLHLTLAARNALNTDEDGCRRRWRCGSGHCVTPQRLTWPITAACSNRGLRC